MRRQISWKLISLAMSILRLAKNIDPDNVSLNIERKYAEGE